MTNKKISDRDLIMEHGSGMSRYAIAKKYKMSVGAVSSRLINMGMPRQPFRNEKEWKILTLSGYKTRHLTISAKLIRELGFKDTEKLIYKPIIKDGKVQLEIKREGKA